MTQEIFLNGVALSELKNTQTLIQKDANKFISDGISQVKTLVEFILESDDKELVAERVNEAYELLCNVDLVANVSGCDFYLDYDTEYYSGDVLSYQLENVEYNEDHPVKLSDIEKFHFLTSRLSDMESQSRQWN
jgi:hypothetical protein